MSTFERYLTVWVFFCIAVGVALGHLMPGVFQVIGSAEIAKVIDAMGEVGRRMPVEFRETALGGLAATPTGKAVKERMPRGAQ